MKDIAFQCGACEEWVESSPIQSVMNWCSCKKLGVDDHANSYGVRVCGVTIAFRKDGVVRNNSESFKKLINKDIILPKNIPPEMPDSGEYIGE